MPCHDHHEDSVPGSALNTQCSVNIGNATATDIFSVTITNDAPATFPIGTTTVTWIATDANGNSSTATQLVTVTLAADTTPPVVTAPANVTVEATGVTTPVTLGTATVTDNVDTGLAATASPNGPFPVGTTTVTWTATDAAGNVGAATQLVTITDTTPPAITVPADVTATSPDNQPVSVSLGTATASDLVDGAITPTSDAPATFPVGTTTVTWTATDTAGNTVTAIQLVTVSYAPPVATEAVYWHHNDHLGTPQALTDVNGTVVWTMSQTPFGIATVNEDPDGDGIAVTNNFRFPGQYFDAETGLSYNYQRTYDPATGRYTQSDPIGLNGGMNPFGYVNGDPVTGIDPFGLYQCTYSISLHSMICIPNDAGHPRFNSSNFVSGNNEILEGVKNNPNYTHVPFHGPIPVGKYKIGSQRRNSSRRDLVPFPANNMFGRNNFQIHGCGNPNTCSEGCVAATRISTRNTFNRLMSLEEGRNTLRVIP